MLIIFDLCFDEKDLSGAVQLDWFVTITCKTTIWLPSQL